MGGRKAYIAPVTAAKVSLHSREQGNSNLGLRDLLFSAPNKLTLNFGLKCIHPQPLPVPAVYHPFPGHSFCLQLINFVEGTGFASGDRSLFFLFSFFYFAPSVPQPNPRKTLDCFSYSTRSLLSLSLSLSLSFSLSLSLPLSLILLSLSL
jgi:hypothetical protein